MSTPPANEADDEHQKSKKPAGQLATSERFVRIDLFRVDTAFKQQRLPAWQPIITANTALPVFLAIGLIFIPIGVVLVITSNGVCPTKLIFFISKRLSLLINAGLGIRFGLHGR
jgi:hypothetical protein